MERIDLAELDGVRIEREFQSTGGAIVRVGSAGEKWFAWHSRKGAAWVFVHDRAMADLADQWLARGEWTEVTAPPAVPGSPA